MFGQVPPGVEQEEAPAAVWDMEIGDSEVELYIAGYWKIGIMGGLSVESGPGGIVFPAAFPGLTDFNFYQEPDITISLWLMNRYYLETTFLEGFDKNTYAVGYRGMEGETIQSVRIGNSDISIDEYSGISVPAPKYNTPGISAAVQTEISTHDVLVRYDPTSEQKKTFLGEYEINEEILELGAYSRGQNFILPDGDIDAGSLELFIADKKGIYTGSDGRAYRRAVDSEYSFSNVDGTVTMADPSENIILAYYEKNGTAVGDSTVIGFIAPLVNGEPDPDGSAGNFSWATTDSWYSALGTYEASSSVTVSSRKALKIFNPGKLGPFESFNSYSVQTQIPDEQWRSDVFLADNSLVESEDSDHYIYMADSNAGSINVYNNNDSHIRSAWSRYPFADSYPQIYGGDVKDRAFSGRTILLSVRQSSGITLGPGVVPGSEQIYINGYETGAASIDYGTGAISFNRFIYPHDRIEIVYRTETTDLAGGDLLIAQGNRFYPSEYLQFHIAEMFRWNIAQNTTTTGDMTSPGGLTIAGGLNYNRENFHLELTANGGFVTPDTTGILSLLGMDESGYSFAVGASLVKPSPSDIWGDSDYFSTNRSELKYFDFYSTNGLGQYYLNNYNWPNTVEDSSQEGPSIAGRLSDDTFDSNVMVFDYDLSNQWSAGDLLLSADGPIDLSNFSSISFYLKKQDSIGTIDVKILIGENGESEDYDNDGFAENIDKSMIVSIGTITSDFSLPSNDDDWGNVITYDFTPTEQKKLSKARSIRVLIESSGTASGRLLVGGIHFEGALFSGKIFDEDSDPDKEIIYSDHPADKLIIKERDDSDTVVSELASVFSEISETFHSSGSKQKALKIYWDLASSVDSTDGEYWTAETNTAPIAADSYGTFNFYIYNDTASLTGTYDIDLTDSRDRGYHFTYSPGSAGWEKLNLSLETGIVSDGSDSSVSTAVIDSDMGELSRFAITSYNTTSGTIYLDEFHYSDASFSLDGNVEFNTDYSYPGEIVSTESGFPIFGDLTVSNQFRFNGGTVLSGIAEAYSSLENYTSIGFEFLLFDLSADLKVNWSETSTDLSGSHRLSFPSDFPYGSFSDSYSRSGSGSDASATRGNEVNIIVPDLGNITISSSSDGNGDDLVQDWTFVTKWEPGEITDIKASVSLAQLSQWDSRDRGNYFSNWIYDYDLLLPETDSVKVRSFKSQIDFNINPKPLGVSFSPFISFDTEASPQKKQTDKGGFNLSLPIAIIDKRDSTWTITPTYGRTFTEIRDTDNTDSFGQGFENLFSDLSNWIPLRSFIPFYELFATAPIERFADETGFLNKASYSPSFRLNLSRKFGSQVYDIFVPHNFEAAFIRSFAKADDSHTSENRFEFSFKQTAINLFGRFGVYNKFDFYDSEDISSSLQFNMRAEDGAVPVPFELIYQNYFSFYGRNNSVLSLENRFTSDFSNTVLSDTLTFKFFWQGEMRERFSWDFINDFIEKEHYWSHEENLQVEINHPWEENEEVEFTSLNISAKHISKVNVPGLGVLRGWLTLGFFGDEELFRTGFEAGLELELSF